MELDGAGRDRGIPQALAGPVVDIFKPEGGSFWQRFGADRIAVVLAGDEYSAGFRIFARLVGAAVTVLQLFRAPSLGQRQQLMA